MAHSYLITSLDPNENYRQSLQLIFKLNRQKPSPQGHPDLLIIGQDPAQTIKINNIRELKKNLQIKACDWPFKIGLILNAENLTIPAQNALLKTLEEPPGQAMLILASCHPQLLLPTIISRCQLLRLQENLPPLPPADYQKQKEIWAQITRASPGNRLLLAQKFAPDKAGAQKIIKAQLFFLRQALKKKIAQNHDLCTNLHPVLKTLRALTAAHRLIDAQVNLRLVVENLFLSYPQALV